MLMHMPRCLKKLVDHQPVQASVYVHMQAVKVMLPVLAVWLLQSQHGCQRLADLHLT